MTEDEQDPRDKVVAELVRELAGMKAEVARLKAGAAPAEPAAEDPAAAIRAEAERRTAEARREAEVRRHMDPQRARLEALARLYAPHLLEDEGGK